MNLSILSYVFLVIVIIAFSNMAESSAEALPSKRGICKIYPRLSRCRRRMVGNIIAKT
uniref:Venom peptide n=1 Tax=Dasymutilla chiron TaxID=374949 RepID=A0A8T9VQH8_DASCH|nr:venom peptide precursor [Dasymutilla chiron]